MAHGHPLNLKRPRATHIRDLHHVDVDGAFLGQLRAEHAGRRGGDIDGDLVGLQADQRLVEGNGLAGLLEPLANGGLAYRFTQSGDFDFTGHLCGLF